MRDLQEKNVGVDFFVFLLYNCRMVFYHVRKFNPCGDTLTVSVPASKSLLNRALVLSAFSCGDIKLQCGGYAEDTRVLLDCLKSLGIQTEIQGGSITVHGCGGNVPEKQAEVYVGSAGTAARFLTVMLAFCGGDYTITSSAQMEKRPMDVLYLLEENGVKFEFLGEPYHFPFRMHSDKITADKLTADTDKSTQYASGILLAAATQSRPLTLSLTGSRTQGSYINLTLGMLSDFGTHWKRDGDEITVYPSQSSPAYYEVEPDLSGACYFYALALLFGIKVLVRRVKKSSPQGDARFLDLLKDKGVRFIETADGLLADGSGISSYSGFDADMRDFSDQTLTVAALAAFADTPSVLRGVGHIRLQECDRIHAICENLTALGVSASSDGENITITPALVQKGTVKTYDDHRVAMAFALIGLKTGEITIENPNCCKKTFENYFEIISDLTK